jgi:hypothetical protein
MNGKLHRMRVAATTLAFLALAVGLFLIPAGLVVWTAGPSPSIAPVKLRVLDRTGAA